MNDSNYETLSYVRSMTSAKIYVEVGSAYLWMKGQSIAKARFIGKIDTAMTPEAIAAQFIPDD